MKNKKWLIYALATMGLWGLWGAIAGISAERGFPETLVYCVWALTMILPAAIVLGRAGWKLDKDYQSIGYGLIIGILGAGGQLILFNALTDGPAYLIFPLISLSPMITIVLSVFLLKERTTWIGIVGIILALIALPLFDYSPGSFANFKPEGWFVLALLVMACWGVQAYFMRAANEVMTGESIFFYMTVSGLLLAPIAFFMTDFSVDINWGLDGPWLAFAIQMLNALGALCLVFAFRYGKAIVVSPLTNAGAPLITAIISLILLGVMPGSLKLFALGLAAVAAVMLSIAPEETETLSIDGEA